MTRIRVLPSVAAGSKACHSDRLISRSTSTQKPAATLDGDH
jgi:hypothetical protein